MDPFTLSVISGVIANVLTAIFAHLGRKMTADDEKKTDLTSIIKNATNVLAEDIEWTEPPRLEEVCLFIESPEVEEIVRQIFSVKFLEIEEQNNLNSIRREFADSFSQCFELNEKATTHSSDILFNILVEGCEKVFDAAIDCGILSAHEAKSNIRFRILYDSISAIPKRLAFITSQQNLDLKSIHKFEVTYRQQVGERHNYIIPPHFDRVRRIPIDNLYVTPDIQTVPREKNEEQRLVNMQDFLSTIYRAVLLGNPGSGKSTLAWRVCHDLATRYSERIFSGRQVTPILVILRDYGAEKKLHNCSLLQFIETTANSKYQKAPPPNAFEYLLLNGRVIVIFDGLDELLDTSYRQEISNDIESFCNLYPSVPVLVTSREVGYDQAPLDEKKFEVFRLAPFNVEKQIPEYVYNWLSIEDEELTEEQLNQKKENFLKDSQIVPDLRSNPLMLALLCNIYRGENYIPKNRPDVYEKCANMLFERWDKDREIPVPREVETIEAHIRYAMMYLAYWIYSSETLQGGVKENELISKATDYLCEWRFEDRAEAERVAKSFVNFCTGRAWVFTDVGTTKEGDKLYWFTHRTFLEYFTARHLVRIYETTDMLYSLLKPKIEKKEWDVVIQLVFQIKNKDSQGAGDKLLNLLVEDACKIESELGWNLLSFAARCLNFMVPSPKVTRSIVNAYIEKCLTWGINRSTKQVEYVEDETRHQNTPSESLFYLLSAASENITIIADSIQNLLIEQINLGSDLSSILAMEISFDLYQFDEMDPRYKFWNSVSENILDACLHKMKSLCPNHLYPCFMLVLNGKVSITDVIRWHGVESIFRAIEYNMYLGRFLFPIAYQVINAINQTKLSEGTEVYIQILKEIGQILMTTKTPLTKYSNLVKGIGLPYFHERPLDVETQMETKIQISIDSDSLFGAFILLATMLESDFVTHDGKLPNIENYQGFLFDSMRQTLSARFKKLNTDLIQNEIDKCGFSDEQKVFTWRWINHEINLVQEKLTENSQ